MLLRAGNTYSLLHGLYLVEKLSKKKIQVFASMFWILKKKYLGRHNNVKTDIKVMKKIQHMYSCQDDFDHRKVFDYDRWTVLPLMLI